MSGMWRGKLQEPQPRSIGSCCQRRAVSAGKEKASSYQGGKWCLPCGYIESEEDFLSAARREVREETGLEVEMKSVISVCSNFFTPELHTLVIVLLAEPTGGALCPADHELEELHWFLPDGDFRIWHLRLTATSSRGISPHTLPARRLTLTTHGNDTRDY